MSWSRRIRGVVLMAVTWAVVWAPIAVLLGVLVIDPDNSMDEMWVVIGAYPGFLSAVVFAALLGVAARGRALGEVSVAKAATLGSISGMLVGSIPFTIGSSDMKAGSIALVIGSIMLMSSISAIASVMIAKRSRNRQLRHARA